MTTLTKDIYSIVHDGLLEVAQDIILDERRRPYYEECQEIESECELADGNTIYAYTELLTDPSRAYATINDGIVVYDEDGEIAKIRLCDEFTRNLDKEVKAFCKEHEYEVKYEYDEDDRYC